MNKDIKLSIIMVNYNTPKMVYECLETILKYVNLSFEVILVENGSKIDYRLQNSEISRILANTCNFQLLTLKTNVGFGGGNNFGAKKAKGEYLFLLNPDTLIIDHSISRLLEFLEKHHEIGAATPLLYQKDRKTLQEGFYGHFQSLSSLIFKNRHNATNDSPDDYIITCRISAAALMIKRELFNKLGGFDEHIFMYMEDDDLCKRVTNLGYKNAVLKTAKIIHLEGQASNNKTKKKYYYKSQSYFWRKHYGFLFTILMQIIRWPYKFVKTNLK